MIYHLSSLDFNIDIELIDFGFKFRFSHIFSVLHLHQPKDKLGLIHSTEESGYGREIHATFIE
jgi:hypothetical protein